MQILLVIVFCVVERQSGGDLGRHLTVVVGVAHRLLEARQAVAGRRVLFRSERIDRRAVLGAVVITLTHALRRVVVFPEHLQQLFVADDVRVIHHPYRLGMAGLAGADFAVGWVRGITAGVARRSAIDPRQRPEQALHAPEAAHCEQGDLHPVGNMGHRVTVHGVQRGDGHRGVTSR
ncbi:hypothetical protein D3C76_1300180 [compost metagenome]